MIFFISSIEFFNQIRLTRDIPTILKNQNQHSGQIPKIADEISILMTQRIIFSDFFFYFLANFINSGGECRIRLILLVGISEIW